MGTVHGQKGGKMAEYITRETFSWIESDRGIVGSREGLEKIGELIRCKDCKYYKSYTLSAVTQSFCNRLGLMAMEVDDFCSRAVRREE